MKIAVASDVHLEFGQLDISNMENAKVLCLCGDILVAHDLLSHEDPIQENHSKIFHEFFQDCANKFEHVLYIAGNHEHYHGDFAKTYDILKERLEYLPNVHILNGESIDIEDVTFFGHTFWTDMNNEDITTMRVICKMMNDFRIIKNSSRIRSFRTEDYAAINMTHMEYLEKRAAGESLPPIPLKTVSQPSTFDPEDAVHEHKVALTLLDMLIDSRPDRKIVVMAHHAPSKKSIHPRYQHDELMNGGYSSDLDDFIVERPNIVAWLHGHVHNKFDYEIGTTRVKCNPRGYIGYEMNAFEWKLEYLDV